ncbi:thiamine phosphate synthase [Sphingomonas solaris]|uniref:Thiamine phosphate synthase n=1 Tax=Alterirhizorhabdus solaris TaxID=2529389 RepID=A0A558RC54_9SPHN|nr:thiamine phosphate synthase [Sphingomonas solaris]TVV76842.1 thiamine phosphate synthase [Sphingomonas solaris]
MKRRQPPPVQHLSKRPLPTRWLMTDERLGEALWSALARLPRGAGVVFRHYATPMPARRVLFDRVRAITRRRRLVLVLAGPPRQALAWGADGAHGRPPHRAPARLLRTVPVHGARELAAARGADLLFVSPVFATRSHPGAATLGPLGLARLARRATAPVVALGGMSEARWRRLGVHGWAAIDAWRAVATQP